MLYRAARTDKPPLTRTQLHTSTHANRRIIHNENPHPHTIAQTLPLLQRPSFYWCSRQFCSAHTNPHIHVHEQANTCSHTHTYIRQCHAAERMKGDAIHVTESVGKSERDRQKRGKRPAPVVSTRRPKHPCAARAVREQRNVHLKSQHVQTLSLRPAMMSTHRTNWPLFWEPRTLTSSGKRTFPGVMSVNTHSQKLPLTVVAGREEPHSYGPPHLVTSSSALPYRPLALSCRPCLLSSLILRQRRQRIVGYGLDCALAGKQVGCFARRVQA